MIVPAFARRMVEDTKILELPLSLGVQTSTSRVVYLEGLVPQFLSNCETLAFENFLSPFGELLEDGGLLFLRRA
jgi:hypothetical protein